MDKQLLQDLKVVVEPFVKERELEFVDMYFRYESGRTVLGILADRPEGGITIDECTFLNKEIGFMIDEKNLVQEEYVLEVSSPGMDRPLKARDDFRRCKGRKVAVYLCQPYMDKLEVFGVIKDVNDSVLTLDVNGQDAQVPLEGISKAKQII